MVGRADGGLLPVDTAHPMTMAEITALMSKVGRDNPELMKSREVGLFIQACIEEARKLTAPPSA